MSGRSASTKRLTPEEVTRHASAKDLFVIVHNCVYDITNFVEEHPGGTDVLLELGGQDATEAFEEVDHSADARELLKGFQVGVLHSYEKGSNRFTPGGSSAAGLLDRPRGSGKKRCYSYIVFVIILLGVGAGAGFITRY